ncbi:hypothetical protein HMPREF0322_02767 [Desulfitobacterium hafniense DP7]|uniref:Uncharacterized protein n=1 Tax=Desulfitobacterium hafniense DP7 TaxID=537010 RepID=G9XP69_DESHA|nr:hypothetical protein HMPREF0322_02767 [Desulfitobacterium hafniense DP7]
MMKIVFIYIDSNILPFRAGGPAAKRLVKRRRRPCLFFLV